LSRNCGRSIRRGMLASFSVAILLSCSLAIAQGAETLLELEVLDSIPLPSGEIRGMAWVGSDRLAVLTAVSQLNSEQDSDQVLLVLQDRSGVVKRQRDVTGILARGLVFDGEYLWGCGDEHQGASVLCKIIPGSWDIEEAYAAPGHHPYDVAFDGEFIWVTDRDSGRMDRFEREKGDVTRSVITPAFSPCGLTYDGRYFWISDSGTGRLYRLAGERAQLSGTVDSTFFAWRGSDVILAFDGRSIWYAIVGEGQAHKIRLH